MAPVNEQSTIREQEAGPQHPRGGPRARLAPRFLLDDDCRAECDDTARVVVPNDQRKPRDPSNYASLLLDNGCRAEFYLTHSKQRIGVASTRQFRTAFHSRAQRSSNLSFLPLRAKKDPSLRSGITSKNTFSANSHAARY